MRGPSTMSNPLWMPIGALSSCSAEVDAVKLSRAAASHAVSAIFKIRSSTGSLRVRRPLFSSRIYPITDNILRAVYRAIMRYARLPGDTLALQGMLEKLYLGQPMWTDDSKPPNVISILQGAADRTSDVKNHPAFLLYQTHRWHPGFVLLASFGIVAAISALVIVISGGTYFVFPGW